MKTVKSISGNTGEPGFVILEDQRTFNQMIVQMEPGRFTKFCNKYGNTLNGKLVGVVDGWIYPYVL